MYCEDLTLLFAIYISLQTYWTTSKYEDCHSNAGHSLRITGLVPKASLLAQGSHFKEQRQYKPLADGTKTSESYVELLCHNNFFLGGRHKIAQEGKFQSQIGNNVYIGIPLMMDWKRVKQCPGHKVNSKMEITMLLWNSLQCICTSENNG